VSAHDAYLAELNTQFGQVPGWREANIALRNIDWQVAEGVELDSPAGMAHIIAIVMGVTRPYMQAEVLADVSDQLAGDGFPELAELLDQVSGHIRKAVLGG
jgi:hypothetical protein